MPLRRLDIIGERINPGFRSTRALFDNQDLAGIQALAIRQAQAGASYLNVNGGTAALQNPAFMAEVVRCIQAVVDLPLSLDCPDPGVQQTLLAAYDAGKARGLRPIVNSLSESRWELAECLRIRPCKAIIMSSERLVDGRVVPTSSGADARESALSMVRRIKAIHPSMSNDDFFIDVSVATLAADTEGLVPMAIDTVRLIREEPELEGVHVMGGLSNLAQHLPPRAADGSDLTHQLECAFLSVAVPLGLDTVLGTPWRRYQLLSEDNAVLRKFRNLLELRGSDALMSIVDLYSPAQ